MLPARPLEGRTRCIPTSTSAYTTPSKISACSGIGGRRLLAVVLPLLRRLLGRRPALAVVAGSLLLLARRLLLLGFLPRAVSSRIFTAWMWSI
jgi:hypothetical protein